MTQQNRNRKKKTKEWEIYFEEYYKRKPTREEGLTFGNGFNAGWKNHMKRASKHLYDEMAELLNNLNDDLELDLKNGEIGYNTHKLSYQAVKKYTLKLLKKKFKIAEHNYKLKEFAKRNKNKD